MNAAVRRNPSGKYVLSILVETEIQALPKTNMSIGIDVGLKDFAILSNGIIYENPNFFRSLEKKRGKAQASATGIFFQLAYPFSEGDSYG